MSEHAKNKSSHDPLLSSLLPSHTQPGVPELPRIPTVASPRHRLGRVWMINEPLQTFLVENQRPKLSVESKTEQKVEVKTCSQLDTCAHLDWSWVEKVPAGAPSSHAFFIHQLLPLFSTQAVAAFSSSVILRE